MNQQEVETFYTKSLQGRWPEWKPTEAEERDWRAYLSDPNLDYLKAVELLQSFVFRTQHLGKRPHIAKVAAALSQAMLFPEKTERVERPYIPATKQQKFKALVDCAGAGRKFCQEKLRLCLQYPGPEEQERWRVVTEAAANGNEFCETLLTEQLNKETKTLTDSQASAMEFARVYGL